MVDISICSGECDDNKTKCYRYIRYHRHHLNSHRQSMCGFYAPEGGTCENFLSLPENIKEVDIED